MKTQVQNPPSRYDADPEGLKATIGLVQAADFRLRSVIRSQYRHHVLRVTDTHGNRLIAKATIRPEDEPNLENEVRAHTFLRNVFATQEIPLIVPSATLHRYRSGTIATFEELRNVRHFVRPDCSEDGFVRAFSNSDMETIVRALLAIHCIPKSNIPAFFLKRAQKEFTTAKTASKLWESYLSPGVKAGVVSMRDAKALQALHEKTASAKRFGFHDYAPWNFLRSGKSLALVDGEYARWEMKWFDVAYFVLQSRVFMGETAFSKKAMRLFLRHIRETLPDEPVEREIWHPLSYWTGACLRIAASNPRIRRRARSLVRPVLERRLEYFI